MRGMPFIFVCWHFGTKGCAAVNDVNVQGANLIGSMKFDNTKLCVVGHYFYVTYTVNGILWVGKT